MKKLNSGLLILSGTMLLMANSANATTIYDNNISALNINMLTDVFMSYMNYGEKMSDLFTHHQIYGTMDRFNEYGDNGSTIRTFDLDTKKTNKYFINNMWVNANHVNADMHYGNNISQRGRFNLATVGANTRTTDLKYGNITFGGFASYINTKMTDFHGNGDVVALFAKYKYKNIGTRALANIGSLNNNSNNAQFNNSWVNFGVDTFGTFKLDDTFFVRPGVYASYTFVSSSDLYLNSDKISSKDYNFFNIAPALSFIKQIAPNWYGALSAKYIAHFGGENDIKINNTTTFKGLYLDDYTDVGIDVEYDYEQFTFGVKIHKQIGDMDGWSTNINIKYAF